MKAKICVAAGRLTVSAAQSKDFYSTWAAVSGICLSHPLHRAAVFEGDGDARRAVATEGGHGVGPGKPRRGSKYR
jgi:hypothetical protein